MDYTIVPPDGFPEAKDPATLLDYAAHGIGKKGNVARQGADLANADAELAALAMGADADIVARWAGIPMPFAAYILKVNIVPTWHDVLRYADASQRATPAVIFAPYSTAPDPLAAIVADQLGGTGGPSGPEAWVR